jgi:hypothetical protein
MPNPLCLFRREQLIPVNKAVKMRKNNWKRSWRRRRKEKTKKTNETMQL